MENGGEAEKGDNTSEDSTGSGLQLMLGLTITKKNTSQFDLNSEYDQPSTSGICNFDVNTNVGKGKGSTNRGKKRKSYNGPLGKEAPTAKVKKRTPATKKKKPVEQMSSPPRTRNYAKLSTTELNGMAERVKIFHEQGIVVPPLEETYVCVKKNIKKMCNTEKCHGEQVPGTDFGKGNIGANFTKYGLPRCGCCNPNCENDIIEPLIIKKVIDSKITKKVNFNIMSCASYGIQNCVCCPKDEPVKMIDDKESTEEELLSISQLEPSKDAIQSDESQIEPLVASQLSGLPSILVPKEKLIQKFFDSFTQDRIDYSKPEQKNIVEGLIHNPIGYYSENLCEELDAPEKTILERIDFQKEQERISMLQGLNNPSTSTQNMTSTPGFHGIELVATSTPKPAPNILVHKNELSPIEGDISGTSPERPIENVSAKTECEAAGPEIYSGLAELNNIGTVEDKLILDKPLDLSTIDTSFVTFRTPLKSEVCPVVEDNFGSEEVAIMDYVNNLMALEEEEIVQECEQRCKRLLRSRYNTRKAVTSAFEAIEIIDDDDIMDNSIQVISEGESNDSSVEFISDDRGNFDDFAIIEGPSTSKQVKNKKGAKMQKIEPINTYKSQARNDNSKMKGISDCSICLEPLHQVMEISSTTCGHIFCTTCIKGVIKSNKKCPICRARLTLKKIHPIFLF